LLSVGQATSKRPFPAEDREEGHAEGSKKEWGKELEMKEKKSGGRGHLKNNKGGGEGKEKKGTPFDRVSRPA